MDAKVWLIVGVMLFASALVPGANSSDEMKKVKDDKPEAIVGDDIRSCIESFIAKLNAVTEVLKNFVNFDILNVRTFDLNSIEEIRKAAGFGVYLFPNDTFVELDTIKITKSTNVSNWSSENPRSDVYKFFNDIIIKIYKSVPDDTLYLLWDWLGDILIIILDDSSKRVIRDSDINGKSISLVNFVRQIAHEAAIKMRYFAPTEEHLVEAARKDNFVSLWETKQFIKAIKTFKEHYILIGKNSMEVSHDDRTVNYWETSEFEEAIDAIKEPYDSL